MITRTIGAAEKCEREQGVAAPHTHKVRSKVRY